LVWPSISVTTTISLGIPEEKLCALDIHVDKIASCSYKFCSRDVAWATLRCPQTWRRLKNPPFTSRICSTLWLICQESWSQNHESSTHQHKPPLTIGWPNATPKT
jgi:hypothetical protein